MAEKLCKRSRSVLRAQRLLQEGRNGIAVDYIRKDQLVAQIYDPLFAYEKTYSHTFGPETVRANIVLGLCNLG